ncbi:MAG: triosephosphate isomerase, triosephosphate isomerase [Parcubacteria group bacterium]|nr:triosephosphate isomerase, triosephosphate isomerase [Parcubacteria group bacterium]
MLIVGNWKAYVETVEKAKKLFASAKTLASKGETEIVVAPPAPYLGVISGGKNKVALAAQDVSITTGGAQTGEVTVALLAELGVTYAIVGHSERRARGETDAMVAEKVRHALAHGITPILCIGEKERDPDAQYLKRIREEITSVFVALSQKERMQIVIAYEPIWAIGKSVLEAITPAELAEMVLYIRKVLGEFLPGRGNLKSRVLYGGSVEPANARQLAAGSGIDGFLVGRASTDAATFAALVKAVS